MDRQTATFDGCREEKCATELLGWVNSQVRIAGASAADFFTPEEIEFISSLYDGCINYFDKKIAGVVGDLKARGISDRTMIVITSDHGEEFAEHGMFLHDQGGYEEYAWHPLIVKFSESRFGGHRVPHWGAVVDIMPTVLDVLGIPVNQQAQGFILLPAVTSDAPVRYDVQMYDVLKTGSRKYFSSKKLLFDVEADPRELDNLFAEQPQVVAELETRLRTLIGADIAAFDSLQASITTPSGGVELSAEEIENLKALGYLTD